MTTLRRLTILILVLSLALPFAPPVFADTPYVVQPGDTLTKIAARFNVTVEALVRANHLADSNVIQVGQTLIIPDGSAGTAQASPAGNRTYVVQSGDSLARIAARLGVTVEALVAANKLTTTVLQIGQTLINPGGAAPSAAGSIYDRISGPPDLVSKIKAGLDWMQAHDPDAYNRVNTYVTMISPSPFAGLAQAIPLSAGRCWVRGLAPRTEPVLMVAAMLYHEASHCLQFVTVGVLTSKEAEVFAYSEQIAFMERNHYPAVIIAFYRKVLAYYASQPDDGQYIPPPDF